MKKLPVSDVDAELKRLGFKVARPDKPLLFHQKICVLIGLAFPRFAFWLWMGTGKTRVALELIYHRWCRNEFDVVLVLGPSESSLLGWEKQIKLWHIDMPYVLLGNSPSAEKWHQLRQFKEGIILATYPGITRMVSELQSVKGKKRKKLKLAGSKMSEMRDLVDACVPDEATKIMNHASLTGKFCNRVSKDVDIFYELTGRPFGRDPMVLWHQLYCVDHGETLGETLGLFREAFFKAKPNYWGGIEYKFKRSMDADLRRVLRHRTITFTADECLDLPPVIPLTEEVSLPVEAKSYYASFVKQLRRQYVGLVERKNIFTRMRQISSGFIGMSDDLTGERVEIELAENPKLDRMMEMIDEIPEGCKFVIMHEFIHSGQMICQALKERKIKHGWLRGGMKNAREVQDRFDYDDDFPGLVVNHKLGAYALNLQVANYLFFFESPVPVIDREQAEFRVVRQGQEKKVFLIDMVMRGTADSRILQFHRQGGNLFKALMKARDPAKLLGA